MKPVTADDVAHMRAALDLARQSADEPGRAAPAPKVGAVVVKDGVVVATAFRGETNHGDHAEYVALKKVEDLDLKGASVFTTLEPCTKRGEGKTPCAERLISSGVSTVWIGLYDPNPRVYRIGWTRLTDSGVDCRDFVEPLRVEIEEINKPFIETYRRGEGDSGRATFDHHQLGGRFIVSTDSAGLFWTEWTTCSDTCVYAMDNEHYVGFAKGARRFDAIDDPGALDFDRHATKVMVGEIAVFRNGEAHLLVQVVDVQEMDRGADSNSVTIEWEARPDRSAAIRALMC